jgi:ParB family transcriptional regulator, chromosome partitioning protein
MTDTIQTIPIDAIDAEALIRDRKNLDSEGMDELQSSILRHGLRMPIEVYETETPDGALGYGLISGFRRLDVFRRLKKLTGLAEYAAIPCFVRTPQSIPEAMIAMVEENEIRAEISPYERGRIALLARDSGFFPTIEEAVDRLYGAASSQKRSRLRALARLAEEVDGYLTAPERLTQAQALRLSNACRAGLGEVIRTALTEASMTDPEGQWQLLLPILAEAEEVMRSEAGPSRPGRPRRVVRPRHGLTVRRELARDGWVLRFTGREATGELVELVMDEVERWVKKS